MDFFSFSIPKNFDFSNTSLDGCAGIGGESLMTSTFLSVEELEIQQRFSLKNSGGKFVSDSVSE